MADIQLEDLPPEEAKKLPFNHPLLDDYALRMENKYGLPSGVLVALKNAGERSNSDAVSSKQAKGVMQTIPGTQKELGITDPTDPLQSIAGGAQYVAHIVKKLGTDDPRLIAAAYHAGPSSRAAQGNFKGAPLTQAYADRVAEFLSGGAPKAQAAPAAAPKTVGAQAASKFADGLTAEDLPPAGPTAAERAAVDPSAGGGTLSFAGYDTGIKTPQAVDRVLSGAGKFFADTGTAIRQRVTRSSPEAYAEEEERQRLDKPLMKTFAGNVGHVGAGALSLALPGGAIGKAAMALPGGAVTSAALTGGALSGVTTPTTEDGQALENAAMGAALGPVMQKVGQGVAAVARPVTNWVSENANLGPLLRKSFNAAASPADRDVVNLAAQRGLPVYGSQLENPGKRLSDPRAEEARTAFTRSLNNLMGEHGDDIPTALAQANERISGVYNRVLANRSIPLDANFGKQATQVLQDYMSGVRVSPNSELARTVNVLSDAVKQGAVLDGRTYQSLLRQIEAQANAAGRSSMVNGQVTNAADHDAAKAFRSLSELLTKQAATVMTPEDAAAFNLANRQWRNMKTLQAAAPVANGAVDFNPTTLARQLKVRDPNAFWYNKGDTTMADMAKYGTKFMGLDANRPTSAVERLRSVVTGNALPLARDALGAATASHLLNDEGVMDRAKTPMGAAELAVLAYLTHKTAGATGRALDPKLSRRDLAAPRGALSFLAREARVTPGVVNAARRATAEDEEQ